MTDEAKKPEIPSPIPTVKPGPDYEMNTNGHDSNRVMLIGSIVILAVAVIGAVIAIAPEVKNIGAQKEKIAGLEAELAAAKAKANKPSQVEIQLSDVQHKMSVLAEQAKSFQADIANGEMKNKLVELEGKFNQVVQQSHLAGLTGMLGRIQSLQQSPEGSKIIENLVGALAATSAGGDVGANFESLRATDPEVAQITDGVAPEDMKAAAMLIAMAQMRKALMRGNSSFDEDLALLKKTLPAEDTELAAAIDRLAPQAKIGVLTPDGLSQEFRGMTGEIVAASLSGQDISLKEKARARMANIMQVEKGGQRISGTQTQIAIAAAQKQLDTGNVQGAVDILNQLQGPAAQQTQPFIDKAQATLMAGNLQNLISQSVVQNVKAAVRSMSNGGLPHGVVNPYGVPAITNKIQDLVPEAVAPQ